MTSRKPRSSALLRRAPLFAESAEWNFELTPARLRWWSTTRARPTLYAQAKSRPYRRVLTSLLLLICVAALVVGTVLWLGQVSWPEGLKGQQGTVVGGLLPVLGVLLLTVVLIIGGGALVLAVFRSGMEFEVDMGASRWHCSEWRLGLGASTTTGSLDDIRCVDVRYYSESRKDHYSVTLTLRRGSRTRIVSFHCDMTEEVMNRHRQWLLEKLDAQRVPPPRPCQPD